MINQSLYDLFRRNLVINLGDGGGGGNKKTKTRGRKKTNKFNSISDEMKVGPRLNDFLLPHLPWVFFFCPPLQALQQNSICTTGQLHAHN